MLAEKIEATLRSLLEGELYTGGTKAGKLYFSCLNMPDDSASERLESTFSPLIFYAEFIFAIFEFLLLQPREKP